MDRSMKRAARLFGGANIGTLRDEQDVFAEEMNIQENRAINEALRREAMLKGEGSPMRLHSRHDKHGKGHRGGGGFDPQILNALREEMREERRVRGQFYRRYRRVDIN